MAGALVQKVYKTGIGAISSSSITLTSAATLNNRLVALVAVYTNTATVNLCTDNAATPNSYNDDLQVNDSGTATTLDFQSAKIASNPSSGNLIVTFNFGAATGGGELEIQEWSGLSAALAAVDTSVHPANDNTAAHTIIVPSTTTTGEPAIGIVAFGNVSGVISAGPATTLDNSTADDSAFAHYTANTTSGSASTLEVDSVNTVATARIGVTYKLAAAGTNYPRSPADTLTAATDTVARRVVFGRTVADTLTIATDVVARVGVFGRSVSDTLTAASDAVVRVVGFKRSPSDVMTAATDVVTRVGVFGRSVSDTLTAASDTVLRTVVYGRSVSDVLTAATDVIVRAGVFGRSIPDVLTAATDVVGRQMVFGRSVSDSLTAASDAVGRVGIFGRTLSDVLTAATDVVSAVKAGAHAFTANLTETLATSDSVVRAMIFGRSLSDALTAATDATARAVGYVRSVPDALTAASDVVTRQMVFGRSISDALTAASDAVTRVGGFVRSVPDTLTAAVDVVVRQTTFGRGLAEALSAASDVVTGIKFGFRNYVVSLTETNVATDSLPTVFAYFPGGLRWVTAATLKVGDRLLGLTGQKRNFTFTVPAFPWINPVFTNTAKAITETLTAAVDAVGRQVVFGRSIAEILTAASDSVSRTLGVNRVVSDVLTAASDVVARAYGKARLLSESLAPATDATTRQVVYGRAVPDTLAPATETVARQAIYGRSVTDVLTAATDVVTGAKTTGLSTAYGWYLTSANTGLSGKGIDKNTLATYSGGYTSGQTISLKKIVDTPNLTGITNITFDRCWIAPSNAQSGDIFSFIEDGFIIKDCDINGNTSTTGPNVAAFRTYQSGINSYQILRCYVDSVRIGTWLDSNTGTGTINDSYFNCNFDPLANHTDGYTCRGAIGTVNINRCRFNANSGVDTGAFFLQTLNVGDVISGITITDSMLEGNGYCVTIDPRTGTISCGFNNNRIRATGFGDTTVGPGTSGHSFTQWVKVYDYDAAGANGADGGYKGAVVNAP